MAGLRFCDDDDNEIVLDAREGASLLAITGGLEIATVSACPGCRSRIVAGVALVDLLVAAPPHVATSALIDLADDAPTLHLYVVDVGTECDHRAWRDPGFVEWVEVIGNEGPLRPRH